MAKEKEKNRKPEPQPEDLVPVIDAGTLAEAEFYKGLLSTNDIPAVIEEQADDPADGPPPLAGNEVTVLVPERLFDEASEVLAEHQDGGEEDEELEEYEDVDDEADEDLDEEFDEDDDFEDDEDDDEDELDDLDDDLEDGDGEEVEDFDEDEEEDRPYAVPAY